MTDEQRHEEFIASVETTLQPLIEQVMNTFGLAGLAIGIVKDNTLVYAKGFGLRNVETGEPVTPHSFFHMASVSKPFVATAIVQLVEEGKIDLHAPVVSYLPYFKLADDRYRAITVQQLLSHSSGMPDTEDYRWYAPEYDDGALERYVRTLENAKLLYAPGESHQYSNAAYEVLGDVIAKVAGEPFEEYVKRHILTPLGMRTSTFLRYEVSPDLATTPHFGMPPFVLANTYPYNRAHAPSSTLHSSIVEMSHWAIANLNRGEIQGKRILQPESYEQLWHRFVETGDETWQEAIGLSWFFGTYRNQQTISHSGSDPGFGTEFILLPAQNAAVIVLANSNTAASAVIADAALDLLLGVEPDAPTPPVVVSVARTMKTEGKSAAIEAYRQLQATQADRYNFKPARFMDTCWGAIEAHKGKSVQDLLDLWLELQPDAAEAHEMMGWELAIRGEIDQARVHLRRTIELDPENDHATALLAGIEE